MKIIEWNICQGGGTRTGKIIDALKRQDADVIVLTEFRNNDRGKAISEALSNYPHQIATTAPRNKNTVWVASKILLSGRALSLGDEPDRYIAVTCKGLTVIALYFAQNEAKRPLFNALLALPPSLLTTPTILIGDFNTGLHFADEEGKTFACADAFCKLTDSGWEDAWRHFHKEAKDYSWYSSKKRGFRIDHLLASPAALSALKMVDYSHGERISGISDHSLLIVNSAV